MLSCYEYMQVYRLKTWLCKPICLDLQLYMLGPYAFMLDQYWHDSIPMQVHHYMFNYILVVLCKNIILWLMLHGSSLQVHN